METLALIVTYNELNNLEVLLPVLLQQNIEVLVVDDNSPDGTPRWLQKYMVLEPRLHALIRPKKLGYGTAVIFGIEYALKLGAEFIVTLDADLSHDPAEIQSMIAGLRTNDLVLGSRYVGGCRVLNWRLSRLMISVCANGYLRTVLRLPFSDCTSGFRAYRADLLRRLELHRIRASGYSLLVEVLFQAWKHGAKISEHPIVYSERREGQSKMSKRVIAEAFLNPWSMLIRYKANPHQ